MPTNSYVVYKRTSPSKKVYIGITSNAPEKRWKNGKGYELFLSVQEAAKFAGVCRTSVSNHLAGKSKTCGNYHFRYVNEVNNDGTDEND